MKERSVVPDAEFRSYYGLPVLKEPVWRSPDIPAYFFLGGLAGASSMLAAAARGTGRHRVADRASITAVAAIGLSAAALIHDLGRPSRFLNMLRVFKPTSPMSIGSWLLAVYGPCAGVAAGTAQLNRWPKAGRVATAGSAVLGGAVATYTAALLSDTAVPAWHDAHRELPFVFAGSSATAAGGVALVTAALDDAPLARTMALLGAAVEAGSAFRMERRLGLVAQPYRDGKAGRYIRAGEVLTAGGLALAFVGRRSRIMTAAAGAALAAASACTRAGIFEGGRQSAADPRFTIEPQRARRLALA
jgi:formate-dependent nitrite reductase membrane component NrfD